MLKIPFFSIIVPVYKVEKYLHQCVDSLLSQNFDGYEIILVDDGSPDECPQICNEYASKSDKVRVVHKINGGLSDARNAGVEVANGRYLTFVDSDDFWQNNKVLTGVYRIIEKYNFPDIIVSDFIKYYDKDNQFLIATQTCSEGLNGKSKQEILENFFFSMADLKMSACQKFVERGLMTRSAFEKGLLSEDIDWSFRIYTQARSIAIYPQPYYCYRQEREGSITKTASQRSLDSIMSIINRWEKQIPLLNVTQKEKNIYFGYLAFQLGIAINLLSKADKGQWRHNKANIKRHLYLFKYPLNSKTKKIALSLKLFGISITALLVKIYLKFRRA